jgi:hypothetical protein
MQISAHVETMRMSFEEGEVPLIFLEKRMSVVTAVELQFSYATNGPQISIKVEAYHGIDRRKGHCVIEWQCPSEEIPGWIVAMSVAQAPEWYKELLAIANGRKGV